MYCLLQSSAALRQNQSAGQLGHMGKRGDIVVPVVENSPALQVSADCMVLNVNICFVE
jgi:hypothetical protein